MTGVRHSQIWVLASLALAGISCFLQWKYFADGWNSPALTTLMLAVLALWVGSVALCFAKGSRMAGLLSLAGILPALSSVWLFALLFGVCAFANSCI